MELSSLNRVIQDDIHHHMFNIVSKDLNRYIYRVTSNVVSGELSRRSQNMLDRASKIMNTIYYELSWKIECLELQLFFLSDAVYVSS